jgi:DNA-binding response OmpR family regulator
VVDLRLADGQDGRDVIRRLREHRPDMPVVVVTGFHAEAAQADLRGLAGPTLRLPKPIDHDDLLEGLAALLRQPAGDKPCRRRASDAPALIAACVPARPRMHPRRAQSAVFQAPSGMRQTVKVMSAGPAAPRVETS